MWGKRAKRKACEAGTHTLLIKHDDGHRLLLACRWCSSRVAYCGASRERLLADDRKTSDTMTGWEKNPL